jgi:hypothetical protein
VITIGTDVEMFLGKDGSFVSAHDLIPGTKYDPYVVKHGAVQVDGVAAEINIDPASTFQEFRYNLQQVLLQLQDMIPGYEILPATTVQIDLDVLPEHVKMLSCETDIDPYTEELNPILDQQVPYRSAGGHIHVGGIFDGADTSSDRWGRALRMARLMDRYLGVPSLGWDKDQIRRKTYGKAGNCRVKEYGVEYRALSNAWLFEPTIMRYVFDATMWAAKALKNGEDGDIYWRSVINDS